MENERPRVHRRVACDRSAALRRRLIIVDIFILYYILGENAPYRTERTFHLSPTVEHAH